MNASTEVSIRSANDRKQRLKCLFDESRHTESLLPTKSPFEILNAVRECLNEADHIIDEGNVLERAENTSEFVMDAQLVRLNHELMSKAMQQSSEFNENMLVNAIRTLVFGSNNANWKALEDATSIFPRTVRCKPSIIGAIDIIPNQLIRKDRQPRKTKSSEKKLTRPSNVDNLNAGEKGEDKLNKFYNQIEKLLKANKKPIPFYKLLIDPNNFMNTINNALNISFLVRDNLIGLKAGKDGYPLAYLVVRTSPEIEMETTQDIMSFNMDFCNEMIAYYNIKHAMLQSDNDFDEEM